MEIFITFLKLGLTSFGGPIAHLSYFHNEFVIRKKWINEHAYADLVALCQFLPGPASSQVGMAIGLSRGGILGSILAWVGFTLPSALILTLFGLGITHVSSILHSNWIHALKVVAFSVVLQAVIAMGKKFCIDKKRVVITIFSTLCILYFNSSITQVLLLILTGLIGAYFIKSSNELPHTPIPTNINQKTGLYFLITFFIILFSLPLLRSLYPFQAIKLFDSFFRAGSLVFGGGHVVLPLLQTEVVLPGWVSNDIFLAGYGIAQAIPGPLFTFSAYLGSVSQITPNGFSGAIICLIAAFLPSYLLIVGVLPFWEKFRAIQKVRQAMLGINACVVGILLAALYRPIFVSAIFSIKDLLLALIAFIMLEFFKLSSWIVVLISILLCLIF